LEVLFGVGFGGGDALKRFVEDADDTSLFRERGQRNLDFLEHADGSHILDGRASRLLFQAVLEVAAVHPVFQELRRNSTRRSQLQQRLVDDARK